MASKKNLAQIPAKLYELLEPLDESERRRVVQATMVLFGEDVPSDPPIANSAGSGTTNTPPAPAATDDILAYFEKKAPKNKGEELAVAARFREVTSQGDSHSKDELKKVINSARRNFDDSHFGRDINNAKRQAGFFNTGTARNANKLSYFGQQFVDALPNRDEIAKLRRPKVGGVKKKSAKKKAVKKQRQ